MSHPAIGMHIQEIDTPALLVDLNTLEKNIAQMADFFRGSRTGLRPHIKTHKTPLLAQQQLQAGATGITCAKLGEAEVMAANGIRNILIANQVVGPIKIRRLVELSSQADMTVAVDDTRNVLELSDAAVAEHVLLGILVEVDIGLGRCGVPPGEPALALAKVVDRAPGLHFLGLMGYEGHIATLPDFESRKRQAEEAMRLLVNTKHLIESFGIPVPVVSAGATGTYAITGRYPEITEVQPGSYIFMDTKYRRVCPEFGCALTVLTTVLSTQNSHRAVVDAGRKSLTEEFGLPEVRGLDGVRFKRVSEEHSILESDLPEVHLKPGDKLEVLPSHCCTTVNLHDHLYATRNERVEAVWDIACRGKAS